VRHVVGGPGGMIVIEIGRTTTESARVEMGSDQHVTTWENNNGA